MRDHKAFYLNLYKGVIIKLTRHNHNSISTLSIEEKKEIRELFKLLKGIYLKIISYERKGSNIYLIRKCVFNYLHHIRVPKAKI